MTLPQALMDREYRKFEEIDGQPAVRVKGTNFEGSVSIRGLKIGGKHTQITINSATWTELISSLSPQRNLVAIQNNTGQDVKINFDDSIAGFVGTRIADGSERAYDVQGAVPIYAKCSTGTAILDIEELA